MMEELREITNEVANTLQEKLRRTDRIYDASVLGLLPPWMIYKMKYLMKNTYRDKVARKKLYTLDLLTAHAAVCLYVIRKEAMPIQASEVAEWFDIKDSLLVRNYRKIIDILGSEYVFPDVTMKEEMIKKYIFKAAAESSLINDAVDRALEIAEKCKDYNHMTNGIAAASVYLSCLETGCMRTQEEIAGIYRISTLTLRNTCKKIEEDYGDMFG